MAFLIDVTWLDDYGRTTTKRYGNDRTLLADAITDAAALVAAMADVSDAGSTKYQAIYTGVLSNAAGEGANVDVGATLHATLDNGKGYALKIPMIKAEKVGSGGAIDVTDEDIVTLVALFKSGGHFTVSEGNVIDDVKSGELDK